MDYDSMAHQNVCLTKEIESLRQELAVGRKMLRDDLKIIEDSTNKIASLGKKLTKEKDMAAMYHDQLAECQRERDEYIVKSDNYCALLMDANQELASTKLDAERLDWLLKNADATVVSGGAYGLYHVWFRYSNRVTDEYKSAREAIDAARKEST